MFGLIIISFSLVLYLFPSRQSVSISWLICSCTLDFTTYTLVKADRNTSPALPQSPLFELALCLRFPRPVRRAVLTSLCLFSASPCPCVSCLLLIAPSRLSSLGPRTCHVRPRPPSRAAVAPTLTRRLPRVALRVKVFAPATSHPVKSNHEPLSFLSTLTAHHYRCVR